LRPDSAGRSRDTSSPGRRRWRPGPADARVRPEIEPPTVLVVAGPGANPARPGHAVPAFHESPPCPGKRGPLRAATRDPYSSPGESPDETATLSPAAYAVPAPSAELAPAGSPRLP